jgi:nicotinate phosphoribosyltransferase
MRPIITSLLDVDLYKYSMQYAVIQKFPETEVQYIFIDRNNTKYPPQFIDLFKDQIKHVSKLTLSDDELLYLESLRFFTPTFITHLKGFKLNDNVSISEDNGNLKISIFGK